MIFSDAEVRFLARQPRGHLATLGPSGTPQVKPLGFTVNPTLGTIDITGFNMSGSAKYRNVRANPKVAFVVDEVTEQSMEGAHFLEIRGVAETTVGTHDRASRPGTSRRPIPGTRWPDRRLQQSPREQRLGRQRAALSRTSQQRQVILSRHQFGAERPQEGTVPLRVDQRAARRGESRAHIRDRNSRRAGMPAEHRISAEHGAHAHAEGAPDQLAVLPDLDAVGPAFLVQSDHAFQQRVGEPARLTARPAFLRHPPERNVRRRPFPATP